MKSQGMSFQTKSGHPELKKMFTGTLRALLYRIDSV